MQSRNALLAATLALLMPCTGWGGDVVLDWNTYAMEAVKASGEWGPRSSRAMAMTHAAMFDAINAIEGRFAPYHYTGAAPTGTLPDAAAASAAHYLLSRLFPSQRARFEKRYRAFLQALPAHKGKADGIRLGEQIGAAFWALRRHDGADTIETYRPATAPGVYVPTAIPIDPAWGTVKPWLLQSPAQFRPPAPASLTSARWAQDCNEVKRMGQNRSRQRDHEQTQIARFWTLAGPATYNPLIRQLVRSTKGDTLGRARAFALVHLVAADTYVAVWEAKYHYHFWRPITAIRNAENDGNDATEADAAWQPAIVTPMHPEYPCAHCATVSAATTVLRALYGETTGPFSLSNPEMNGYTRHYTTLHGVVAEVTEARVNGGVHYRFSTEAGNRLGAAVARFGLDRYLRSTPR